MFWETPTDCSFGVSNGIKGHCMITMHDLNSLYPSNWVSGECVAFCTWLVLALPNSSILYICIWKLCIHVIMQFSIHAFANVCIYVCMCIHNHYITIIYTAWCLQREYLHGYRYICRTCHENKQVLLLPYQMWQNISPTSHLATQGIRIYKTITQIQSVNVDKAAHKFISF